MMSSKPKQKEESHRWSLCLLAAGWMLAVSGAPSLANYDATLSSQSRATFSLKKGTRTSVWVRLTNTGSDTWGGSNAVRVGTWPASVPDRSSVFCDSTWIVCHRPGGLEANVSPGQVGHFRFVMKAPDTTGTYTENFHLLCENVAWFGPVFTWTITVTDGDVQGPSVATTPTIGTACKIEGEDYDYGGEGIAWHDGTLDNNYVGKYRRDSVDIETCQDTGGGYDLAWTEPGEWLEYTVNVATAGNYQIRLRAATDTPGTYQFSMNGVAITGVETVGSTGGWQIWITTAPVPVSLSAGNNQVLRYDMPGGEFNLNWILIEPSGCESPVISAHPSDATKIVGQTATFQVTATGTSLSYRWQKKPSGGDWADIIPAATSAQYTTPVLQLSDHGNKYRCVVSNTCGSQTSNEATLTVTNWSVTPAEGATRKMMGGSGTCDPDPTDLSPVQYTVSNIAPSGSLQYTVSKEGSGGWLSLDKVAGTVTAGNSDTVTGTINAAGLTTGAYHCDLLFQQTGTPLFERRTVTLLVFGLWEYLGDKDPRDANSAGPGLSFALVEGMDNGDITGPGIVEDDPLADDGKVWHIQDPSGPAGQYGAKTKLETQPTMPILGSLGATVVARVRVRSLTEPREGGLYIWSIGDGLSAAYHWGGAADGRVQEIYRNAGTNLTADDGFHILRMTVEGVDTNTRLVQLYFDEGSSPAVAIPQANFSTPGGYVTQDGFGFGAGASAGTYDIAFDWFTATNAGAFGPGEEVACLGRSLIPSVGFFADADEDGDVDQIDFAAFQLCCTGADGGVPTGCGRYDRDRDGDVDMQDFTKFSACNTGPEVHYDLDHLPTGCVP